MTRINPFSLRIVLGLSVCCCSLNAVNSAAQPIDARGFQLSSTAVGNGKPLPLSAVNNILVNDVNTCTADGAAGGNKSPPLFWAHVPRRTRSFVVTLFDLTASFTHWGIYNIAGNATGLPSNAGAVGSTVGKQIYNDFGNSGYGGPCPPHNLEPDAHRYIFTVYALDTPLELPLQANFPTFSGTLYQALLLHALGGHILGKSSLLFTYSSTPAGH
ncbi:MAG TPA: YbhB/YbcL family Raf kinase inhibitor-like protein [Methylocella sp.]|nr:YbhB/YbcL family Raf kinase inhibitor-like protein [Methylocella sp.]